MVCVQWREEGAERMIKQCTGGQSMNFTYTERMVHLWFLGGWGVCSAVSYRVTLT